MKERRREKGTERQREGVGRKALYLDTLSSQINLP